MKTTTIILLIAVIVLGGIWVVRQRHQFSFLRGETVPRTQTQPEEKDTEEENSSTPSQEDENSEGGATPTDTISPAAPLPVSSREQLVTAGVVHSIPLDEVLAGGPAKDGIPSIDDPKFTSTREADEWLDDTDIGLGITIDGQSRFYPYRILVWHELANDTLAGEPILVSYCPLCATGVVFDRRIDGRTVEFGVSGLLWQSNLLMYDRTSPDEKGSGGLSIFGASPSDFDADTQSLWSQVLGEAVWGTHTGKRLAIVSSDTVRYGDWKREHPDTDVLSRDTGISRNYGRDPYGGNTPILGATFTDTRLDAKDFVLGVERDGQFKAYLVESIPEGTTTDTFAGESVTLERDSIGGIRMFIGEDREPLPYIGGFWFSWVAVHPQSELFK